MERNHLMTTQNDLIDMYFDQDKLDTLLPPERADKFFDALFGDPQEGAYDIRLTYQSREEDRLRFSIELRQRPGKCLACNLTYGLPQVFTRHPVIDLSGVVAGIEQLMEGRARCSGWSLEATREVSADLHVVPLVIEMEA
jgi:hypothetical protein